MSLLALAATRPFSRTSSLRQGIREHIIVLNIVSTILVIAFVLVYIAQANGSVAKGYALREVEQKIEALTLENQRLEVDSRHAQSLEQVARNMKMLGMVDAERPSYVQADAPSYALAE